MSAAQRPFAHHLCVLVKTNGELTRVMRTDALPTRLELPGSCCIESFWGIERHWSGYREAEASVSASQVWNTALQVALR